ATLEKLEARSPHVVLFPFLAHGHTSRPSSASPATSRCSARASPSSSSPPRASSAPSPSRPPPLRSNSTRSPLADFFGVICGDLRRTPSAEVEAAASVHGDGGRGGGRG
ncbi:Os01g0906450, partial [Oryza sativa Japonica Group]